MHRAPKDEVLHFKVFSLHAKQQCLDETFGRPQLAKVSGGVYPTSKHLIFEKFFCVPWGILRSKPGIPVCHHR